MEKTDVRDLPDITQRFVARLVGCGLERLQVHGFFVLLGIFVGAPDAQEEKDKLREILNQYLPLDHSKNIEDLVGHFYGGYDSEINEFCFRSGAELEFRKIAVPGANKELSIVYLRNEGLLDPSIISIDRLVDSSRLFDSFLKALGQQSLRRSSSLLESFACGVFQGQLHGISDISGTRQLAHLIKVMMPIYLGAGFHSILDGRINDYLKCLDEQAALSHLMGGMETTYAKELWVFQSHLFYNEQKLIAGISDFSCADWHKWVVNRAEFFDAKYQLTPFSKSGVTLTEIPSWGLGIRQFELCDKYLEGIWGYSEKDIRSVTEKIEYKALMVHLVFASLTSSREVLH